VGGYGTWEEARLLAREAPRLRPDLAVVAFYVGNDPSDNLRHPPPGREGGPPAAAPAAPPRLERLKRWLGSRLHVYALASVRGDELLVRTGLRRLVYPFEIDVLMSDPPEQVEVAWEATRAALSDLAEVIAGQGMRALVVVVPMKHQVSDPFWERLLSQYRRLGRAPEVASLDRERPQRTLGALLDEAGIERLDLTQGLRAAARAGGADLYWERDQHWTAAGHAEAARLIAVHLENTAAPPGGDGRVGREEGDEGPFAVFVPTGPARAAALQRSRGRLGEEGGGWQSAATRGVPSEAAPAEPSPQPFCARAR
jgi:hypothetical protein